MSICDVRYANITNSAFHIFAHVLHLLITQYSSTVYIGIAMVYPH